MTLISGLLPSFLFLLPFVVPPSSYFPAIVPSDKIKELSIWERWSVTSSETRCWKRKGQEFPCTRLSLRYIEDSSSAARGGTEFNTTIPSKISSSLQSILLSYSPFLLFHTPWCLSQRVSGPRANHKPKLEADAAVSPGKRFPESGIEKKKEAPPFSPLAGNPVLLSFLCVPFPPAEIGLGIWTVTSPINGTVWEPLVPNVM